MAVTPCMFEQELGVGHARVRSPHMAVIGEELEAARAVIREAVRTRPKSASSHFPGAKP